MRLSAELLSQAEQRPNPLGERELVLRGLAIPAIEHLAVTRDAFDAMDFTDNRLLRLENFPRLTRLSSLSCSGNLIESIDPVNLKKNTPNITSLTLSYNRLSALHEVANLGTACPKLAFLSLTGNPVTSKYLLLSVCVLAGYDSIPSFQRDPGSDDDVDIIHCPCSLIDWA